MEIPGRRCVGNLTSGRHGRLTLEGDLTVVAGDVTIAVSGDGHTDILGDIGNPAHADVVAADAVGYWRLGDSALPTAADSAGTRDGTYTNVPAANLGQPGAIAGDDGYVRAFNGGNHQVEVLTTRGLGYAAHR